MAELVLQRDMSGEKTGAQQLRTCVEKAKSTFPELLILAIAAVLLALPVLIYGPMPTGHDGRQHLNYSFHFAQQFWRGEWCPKWLLNMNHGLGSPSLFVYPPFVSYVYAFLEPVGRVFRFNAFNAGAYLALFGSGFAAFLWLRTMTSRHVALASASLYMLIPYHLAIDFYRRTALSECWALAWMPLFLYFATQVTVRKRIAFVGMAMAYALLILSHLVSVVIFSLIPLAAALFLSPRGERIQSALRVAGGMALGIGLSSFYLIPALSEAKNFPVGRLLGPASDALAKNFIQFGDLKSGSSSGVGFVHWVSLSVLSMIAFITICAVVVIIKGTRDSIRKTVFWLVACMISCFLMSSVSLKVWLFFPPLFKALQYQWRLGIVLCLGAAFMCAVFLSELALLPRIAQMSALAVASLFVLAWLVAYGQVWRRYGTESAPLSNPKYLVNDDDGWFWSWSVPGLDQASALKATAGPQVRFLGGAGASDVRRWEARQIEFQTDSPTGGQVMINQFYYPSWTASLDDAKLTLQVKAAMPEGLVELEVPPGHHKIQVEIPISRAERVGRWISVVCVPLSLTAAWRKRAENTRPS